MVRTKVPLSSSSGAWLFLFMGVALLLLPSAFGQGYWPSSCKKSGSPEDDKCKTNIPSNHKYCVKTWDKEGSSRGVGCQSEKVFSDLYGFTPSDGNGCGAVSGNRGAAVFACVCDFQVKGLCNDETLGEEEYKKWKATNGAPSGHSKNLVQLTFFLILTATLT